MCYYDGTAIYTDINCFNRWLKTVLKLIFIRVKGVEGMKSDINGYGVSFGSDENMLKLVIVTQLCKYTKTIELWILSDELYGIWIRSHNAVKNLKINA
jgi:hypothetical protein